MTAIGSSPGNARMDLTTDANHHFVFYTDGRPFWTINSDDGSSLSFNSIMVDQYGDHHGYMILRIPSSKIRTGKSLQIKVTGGEANLTSWYMTYKKQVKTSVTLNSFPAIIKKDNEHLQFVEAAVFYFGKPVVARIYTGSKLVARPVQVRLRIVSDRAEHYMTGNTVFEMQTGDMIKFRNNLRIRCFGKGDCHNTKGSCFPPCKYGWAFYGFCIRDDDPRRNNKKN